MALQQRLDLRQTQALVMTPQLQQAIKLLQLSNLELSEFVEREIEQNPLLERDDGERWRDAPPDGVDRPEPEAPVPEGRTRDTVELAASDRIAPAADAPLDTDYENVWTNSSQADIREAGDGGEAFGSWSARGGSFEDDEGSLEQTLTGRITLRDHLEQQIVMDMPDPLDRLVARALTDQLDEAGYLTADLAAVAEQLGCPAVRVEAVLARLQKLDPPGIFARSLKECLALQLRELDRLDPCMQALLDNLPLLAGRNIPALLKACQVDAEDLADMVAEIKALNPKPALAFDHAPVQTVVPDILMRPAPGGGWIVELNTDTLPKVLVNQRYYARVSGAARNRTEKEYISERFQQASWLVKSLHQRANTILKVATEIVRQQDAFFLHGLQFLKPLILRDIADAIGMHESTVSRVTTNKFIATPRGVFELKYFFTSAIAGADGQAAHSAEAVRYRIKSLIDAEKPDDVLSDDKLVEILRAEGIDIARRTVAKYREGMKIPSSVQRRREKVLGL
ncbi:RNA polymerase factor sigma-54 [Rhodospirillum centenum]|uniref:RNA polymerase sigma-54 factor n=1 Tax=Rhodospirillum centenum (strain ATCC 51521 / SW) TaxID=414684 RepID=B6IW91_RHOCS|nr:RNA polymerase factor sigma-54 [Rhodospirillum centenum]ACJ00565.1 RNA polymerase sigma-54 factor RpoN [Rhodospirillum centenum SW]